MSYPTRNSIWIKFTTISHFICILPSSPSSLLSLVPISLPPNYNINTSYYASDPDF